MQSAPVIPKPAATVLALRERDGLEVLMMTRADRGPFASALVFPGGKIDEADRDPAWDALVAGGGADREGRAARIAAWRELFEEVGLLPAGFVPADCDPARPFIETVAQSGRLPLEEMVPFARWITPPLRTARFDTHFFLCALDGDPVCDGTEAISAEWLTPAAALARPLIFPTRCQIERIAAAPTVVAALAAARAQPVVTIEPLHEQRADGIYARIPAGGGYPASEMRVG